MLARKIEVEFVIGFKVRAFAKKCGSKLLFQDIELKNIILSMESVMDHMYICKILKIMNVLISKNPESPGIIKIS